MNAIPDIRGIVCPMVTPLNESDQIDHAAARRVVEFLLARGVDCLMVGGTTGEGMLLRVEERRALLATVIDAVASQAPVIAHTGCINTADTIELTRHAAGAGATAVSIIAPYFYTLDDESLFNHYLAAARAVPGFPVFVYVFPGNAKNDVSPSLLERLIGAAPNIVGCKSSNPDLIRFQGYVRAGGERFLPFNGVDGLMLPALALGSKAQVSGNSNVCPEAFCELYAAFQAGDVVGARAAQARINHIRAVLHDGITPAFFKLGLTLRGVPAGRVRPPMRELRDEEAHAVERGLGELGVI